MAYYNGRGNNVADYVDYYRNQAGCGLPGYAGGAVMYWAGLGGLFRGLFRMAVPLLKKGFNIAKPHLKAAAKNIVSDVVSNAMSRSYNDDPKAQDGSGLMVMTCKRTSKPPGIRRRGHSLTKTKKVKHGPKVSVRPGKCKKTVKRNVSTTRSVKNIF